nr:hypothetical protein [Tanacetum cinerariifolium]
GNKGIGFEICKQLVSSSHDILVVLTARDEKKGLEALHDLKKFGLSENIVFQQLDVTDPASITSLADFIATHFGKLDILVNNAGISGIIVNEGSLTSLQHEPKDAGPKGYNQVMLQTHETSKDCIQTNYYGTKHVTEALLPFLHLSTSPRILNISSGVGKLENIKDESVKDMLSDVDRLTEDVIEDVVSGFLHCAKNGTLEEKGWNVPLSAYIVSKTVINAYTRVLAKKYPSFRINAGFVKTDMTFHKGMYTVEEGARGLVMLALIPDDGPSGCFFFQMEETTF